jgi:hypothetical protein
VLYRVTAEEQGKNHRLIVPITISEVVTKIHYIMSTLHYAAVSQIQPKFKGRH